MHINAQRPEVPKVSATSEKLLRSGSRQGFFLIGPLQNVDSAKLKQNEGRTSVFSDIVRLSYKGLVTAMNQV